jgi:hypothetical protein
MTHLDKLWIKMMNFVSTTTGMIYLDQLKDQKDAFCEYENRHKHLHKFEDRPCILLYLLYLLI